MSKTEPPRAWRALQAALLGAGLFSAGSAWASGGCASCKAATGIFAGGNLGLWGVLSYALLLGASGVGGPSVLLWGGILAAAGIHAGLLAILLQARLFCGFCLGAAACSGVALALAIRLDGRNAFRASWMVPAAAAIVQSWALLGGGLPALRPVLPPGGGDLAGPEVPPGGVRMVVYVRPDCGYCIELERRLPLLEHEFGGRLRIERRSAQDLPGLPTPTLILSGARGRRFFPGLPEADVLRRSVEELLEESHERQTLPEKP